MNKRTKIIIAVASIITLVVVFASIIELNGLSNPTEPSIAKVRITGPIAIYGGTFDASSDRIVNQIEKANKDNRVKAIILEINSPGGNVVASKEIANAVSTTEKPVVAWIREVGASGAYWIAASSDAIVADSASITGSVGVTASYIQFAGLMEEYGVTYERLVTGEFKDTGSPFKDLDPVARRRLMSKLDAINEEFSNHVQNTRNITPTTITEISTGDIYLGAQALDLKLIDVLGGEDQAIKTAEDLAGIEDSKILEFYEEPSFIDLIAEFATEQSFNMGVGIGKGLDPIVPEQELSIMAQI